jgi:DeoR/GlpR family transcriptional regulator of sugar metabolism
VRIDELTQLFGVSEVTVRRDLKALGGRRGVERVRGGAFLTQRELSEYPIRNRETVRLNEKRRIGGAAAAQVCDGDTIVIGGGTTTAEMVPHLAECRDLVVITPALNIASALADHSSITVIVTGGILLGPELTLAGHYAEQTMRNLRADKLFIGVGALDLSAGLTSAHPSELGVDRAMMDSARQRFLLADHSKFNRVSTCVFGQLSELQCIITDDQAPPETVAQLRKMGIEVLCA